MKMDIFKVEYPVIIEGCKPFLDMYKNKFVDDKFIIRCLEDVEGMVIIVYLQEKYNIFEDFKNICVNDQLYKFNTDEKMENELSKYEYGVYNNTNKKMIILIQRFPYVLKNNKWIRDFGLDFEINS